MMARNYGLRYRGRDLWSILFSFFFMVGMRGGCFVLWSGSILYGVVINGLGGNWGSGGWCFSLFFFFYLFMILPALE